MGEAFINEPKKQKGFGTKKLFGICIVIFVVGLSVGSWLLAGNPLSVWQSLLHALTGLRL